ncbi:hypothetical protein KMZ29_02605 [Bradyrhizobium sediminis]|uniref:Uncharacterized protein n=2 Tax=Bradyrhizobium sediminis TaxID=2840469 RepID=A0A975RMH8_9BRAD|nr:hypothetical protein [Bradyrhizobium sediminis]QWG13647.1 hypothetical protein KMZ29_02605 [Bradyrhizobium sediminis]
MANERPASWRMPSPKQMEKLAREAARQPDREKPEPGPGDPLPDELWDAVLADPRAAGRPPLPVQQCCLSEIPRHVLRVECMRCFRIIEIQKADAVKYYGPHAVWKDVGQRLLDQTCSNRTGRHEEDGCWPDWRG